MTKQLYIIGNGFDIAHNLPTRYSDFHNFLEKNNCNILNFFEEHYRIDHNKEKDDTLWSRFEEDLSTFNNKSFYQENKHFDISEESFKVSMFYSLEDTLEQESEEFVQTLKELMIVWANTIDCEDISFKKNIDKDSLFMTFNYTNTLERGYNIPKNNICHIHGSVECNYCVIGHGEDRVQVNDDPDSFSIASASIAASTAIYHLLRKPVKEIINDNYTFFNQLTEINQICVIGHAFSNIDMPYFKEVHKRTPNANWRVGYYQYSDKSKFENKLLSLGIPSTNIIMEFSDDLM